MKKIRIGTRESPLAMRQTQIIIDLLREKIGLFDYEIISTKTLGDKLLDISLKEIGGKGVFVKDIEAGLLTGEIDLAVHSAKDMPFKLLSGLTIGAIAPRAVVNDVLIFRDSAVKSLADLPPNAVIGTSSSRRDLQLLALRADLKITDSRGKIETRLAKLQNGEFDAIILAEAGLARMAYLKDLTFQRFSISECVPAVGQGALAVECRKDDIEMLTILEKITDNVSAQAVAIEREFLEVLNGNCELPLGAYAEKIGETWQLTAFLAENREISGKKVILMSETPQNLGRKAAEKLLWKK
ncbi:porphobilinogen deaminase [Lactococcus hodotermopsidis]|uniref:Porphobilinogen deaminase n=1 Tax=Pseudolactococcus hodotermopsidis TaxID=2709157 RepID=A0A6A0B8S0_9LACT|nr:hydroxymethylbilane synthase [Lactococcus hodotermopsidis]GFH41732.1 porphobilinogen deaminase [Lactococcus hodotermopsidis]